MAPLQLDHRHELLRYVDSDIQHRIINDMDDNNDAFSNRDADPRPDTQPHGNAYCRTHRPPFSSSLRRPNSIPFGAAHSVPDQPTESATNDDPNGTPVATVNSWANRATIDNPIPVPFRVAITATDSVTVTCTNPVAVQTGRYFAAVGGTDIFAHRVAILVADASTVARTGCQSHNDSAQR